MRKVIARGKAGSSGREPGVRPSGDAVQSADAGSERAAFDPALALPKKRSLAIAGHRTSITLEDAFWRELKASAEEQGRTVATLVAEIDAARGPAGLSAAIRVWLLERSNERAPRPE
ncbi:ribbon-helix-helix domain-containing protein [Rhodomicrobium sp.]|uniref:ribbon-helix-helix domain-containing protein n=1 Tax=Rhodomicrobium sp. TaxID=2720632 RepID=UPI0039E31ACE